MVCVFVSYLEPNLRVFTHSRLQDSINSILPRVQDIIRQKLEKDKKLFLLSSDAMYGELMQEMER